MAHIAKRHSWRVNPRRMTVKQKLHFGTARQRAAARASLKRKRQPARRGNIAEGFYRDGIFHPIRGAYDYSRKRAGEGRPKRPGSGRFSVTPIAGQQVHKRKPTKRGKPRRKNTSGLRVNPEYLISLGKAMASNPSSGRKRSKSSMTKKRATRRPKRKATRRNYFHRAAPRRHNPSASRRKNRRYNSHRRYQRNPRVTSRIPDLIVTAGYTIGGAVGTRAITQAVLGAANTGAIGYGANAAAAFGLGMLGRQIFGKPAGNAITVGGFVGIVLRAIQEFTGIGKAINLQLTGLGDYSFAGLGRFDPMDYFVPLASADQSGRSAASVPPDMIARSAPRALPPAGNGVAGLGGRSRYTGTRNWGG